MKRYFADLDSAACQPPKNMMLMMVMMMMVMVMVMVVVAMMMIFHGT